MAREPAWGQPNGTRWSFFSLEHFCPLLLSARGDDDALRKEGCRVIAPTRSDWPNHRADHPYNSSDMAPHTRLILRSLNVEKAMVVGHSMGGMLAARFATQFPDVTERLVLYNPIGLVDPRFERPWESTDESYKRTLAATYQTTRAAIMRYVAHDEGAWTPEFEKYVRVRYAWTLGADWPRLAMVQTLINQVQYLDPVVAMWATSSPTWC